MDDAAHIIPGLIDEYMRLLDTPGDGPVVEIHDNLGSKFLGVARWDPREPNLTIIELQRRALSNPRTLERVLAHEMIHHDQYARMTKTDVALAKVGLGEGHGTDFQRMAAIINDVKGEGFVTRESDQGYEVAPNQKSFYVLVEPIMNNRRVGWSWTAKTSKGINEEIQRRENDATSPAALITSVDERFLTGTKIKRFGGRSVATEGSDLEADLWDLYHEAMADR